MKSRSKTHFLFQRLKGRKKGNFSSLSNKKGPKVVADPISYNSLLWEVMAVPNQLQRVSLEALAENEIHEIAYDGTEQPVM